MCRDFSRCRFRRDGRAHRALDQHAIGVRCAVRFDVGSRQLRSRSSVGDVSLVVDFPASRFGHARQARLDGRVPLRRLRRFASRALQLANHASRQALVRRSSIARRRFADGRLHLDVRRQRHHLRRIDPLHCAAVHRCSGTADVLAIFLHVLQGFALRRSRPILGDAPAGPRHHRRRTESASRAVRGIRSLRAVRSGRLAPPQNHPPRPAIRLGHAA